MAGSEVRPQLTDLQKSYLVGRELKRSLGGVACHTYLEFDGADVDGARLRRAWKRLTARHAMTRARVDKDGDLRIGSDAGNNTFWLIDAREHDDENVRGLLDDCRKNFSHRIMDLSRGQGCGLVLVLLPAGRSRMCFDVDLVLCDVNGFQELLGELARIYEDPDCALPPLIWGGVPSVRDFNVVEVDSLVPSFAFGKNAAGLSGCRYRSLDERFDEASRERLQALFEGAGSDLFCGMLACLAKTAASGDRDGFVANIPWFAPAPDGEDPVRDLTELVWLSVERTAERDAVALAREIRAGFLEQRASARPTRYACSDSLVPLVYSFNQNGTFIGDTFRAAFGDLTYMISQTPNVCLDAQFFLLNDGLLTSWVFPQEMEGAGEIEAWFERFSKLVHELLARPAAGAGAGAAAAVCEGRESGEERR